MILVAQSDSTFCWLDQLTHFVRELLIVKKPLMLLLMPQLRCYILAPLHLPRRPTRLVSYYAFFK